MEPTYKVITYLEGEPDPQGLCQYIDEKGTVFWFWYGLLHREDGPAIIRPDGLQEWWLNGVEQINPAVKNAPAPPVIVHVVWISVLLYFIASNYDYFRVYVLGIY